MLMWSRAADAQRERERERIMNSYRAAHSYARRDDVGESDTGTKPDAFGFGLDGRGKPDVVCSLSVGSYLASTKTLYAPAQTRHVDM
jgi:hypothetical protein